MSKRSRYLGFVLPGALFILLAGFQNCSGSNFSAGHGSDAATVASSQPQAPSTSTPTPIPSPSNSSSPSPQPSANYPTSPQIVSQPAFQQSFNFVDGNGAAHCNQTVLSTLGISTFACTMGGGCSIDGQSPSSGHASANPNSYGVCIHVRSPANAADIARQTYNFVAGDKSTCELQIARRFGVNVSCSLGGGCSIDGNVPSASHPSANPNEYGSCLAVSFY